MAKVPRVIETEAAAWCQSQTAEIGRAKLTTKSKERLAEGIRIWWARADRLVFDEHPSACLREQPCASAATTAGAASPRRRTRHVVARVELAHLKRLLRVRAHG